MSDFPDYQYESTRRVQYSSGATFVPVCDKCYRYVKAHETICVYEDGPGIRDEANADCSQCGPTQMLFEGFI